MKLKLELNIQMKSNAEESRAKSVFHLFKGIFVLFSVPRCAGNHHNTKAIMSALFTVIMGVLVQLTGPISIVDILHLHHTHNHYSPIIHFNRLG